MGWIADWVEKHYPWTYEEIPLNDRSPSIFVEATKAWPVPLPRVSEEEDC